MRKILYFFYCIVGFFAFSACNNIHDEENNLLNNIKANTGGLTGPRFLYQESDGGVVRVTYLYDQTKLSKAVATKFVETVSYSGDNVYKIEHQDVGKDSLASYTRMINYIPNSTVINNISEDRTFSVKDPASTPTNPKPNIITKTKSLYTLTYTGNVITNVVKKTAVEVPGKPLDFTRYEKYDMVYSGNNVQSILYMSGKIVTGQMGDPTYKIRANYLLYDDKKGPRSSLLPYVFNFSQMLDAPLEAHRLSANNAGRITIDDFENPVQFFSSLFTYDAQDYLLTGYGRFYDYRPF